MLRSRLILNPFCLPTPTQQKKGLPEESQSSAVVLCYSLLLARLNELPLFRSLLDSSKQDCQTLNADYFCFVCHSYNQFSQGEGGVIHYLNIERIKNYR